MKRIYDGPDADGRIDRILNDESRARGMGFAPKPPLFSLGHPINDIGKENLRRSRQNHEALPFLAEGCDNFRAIIAKESRKDTAIPLRELTMTDEGQLVIPEVGTYPLEEDAFKSLCRRVVPTGATSYLADCDPELRAYNLNHWFAKKTGRAQTVIRTRNGTGPRRVWATIGANGRGPDAVEIAGFIPDFGVREEARVDIFHDGYKTRFDIVYHTDIRADQGGAGEIFKVGTRIARDDSTNRTTVCAFVLRNLCLNLLIIDEAKKVTADVTGLFGDEAKRVISTAVKEAEEKVKVFADAWLEAEKERVIEEGVEEEGVKAAFERLIDRRLIKVPGEGRDMIVQGLVTAWNQEPGYNKTSVINAITRYAHQGSYANPWASEALEEAAGQLLYRKVALNLNA